MDRGMGPRPVCQEQISLGDAYGAVVSGILDAVEVLDVGVARKAIDFGSSWKRASVRLVALELLAAIDPDAARPSSRGRRRREGPRLVASAYSDGRRGFPRGSTAGAGEGAGPS